MSLIFWGLVLLTVVFAGALIYRISVGVRQYNLDREQKILLSFGMASDEVRAAEFDLLLLRWACVFGALTVIWGLGEGIITLFS